MSRLIDADALIEDIRKNSASYFADDFAHEWVDRQPTIEERKKGEWIRHDEIKNIYGGICIECSECGEKYVVRYIEDEKFCRNCGADMKGGSDGQKG